MLTTTTHLATVTLRTVHGATAKLVIECVSERFARKALTSFRTGEMDGINPGVGYAYAATIVIATADGEEILTETRETGSTVGPLTAVW